MWYLCMIINSCSIQKASMSMTVFTIVLSIAIYTGTVSGFITPAPPSTLISAPVI